LRSVGLIQLTEQRQREIRAAQASERTLFGRVLAFLTQFAPAHVAHLVEKSDISAATELLQLGERLNPL
jgi:hypothetical protein